MDVVPLAQAEDESLYGGKAHFLGVLARATIPVPDGVALATSFVLRIAQGEQEAAAELAERCGGLTFPVAVRSSAVGEDSRVASHAGQFATKLNVRSPSDVVAAVQEVLASAASADAYRARFALGPVSMGVVVQRMITPRTAGVMFTCDPVTGERDILIEASWGLGEAVVSSLVVPDTYRLTIGGKLVDCRIGDKSVMLVPADDTDLTTRSIVERAVSPDQAAIPCLSDADLAHLYRLALRCEDLMRCASDVEWGISDEGLFALQCRPITIAG